MCKICVKLCCLYLYYEQNFDPLQFSHGGKKLWTKLIIGGTIISWSNEQFHI